MSILYVKCVFIIIPIYTWSDLKFLKEKSKSLPNQICHIFVSCAPGSSFDLGLDSKCIVNFKFY